MSRSRSLLPLTAVVLLSPSIARAYLNPDQGSMLLQIFLGGVAGAAVVFKMFWQRIVSFFSRRRSADKTIEG